MLNSVRKSRNGGLVWHFVAILTVFIWGTTFVSTKLLLNAGLTASGIFLLRFVQAYVGMLIVSHRRLFCDTMADEWKMIVLGLTGGSLYFLTENNALRFTLVGNVSLEVCTAPLITLIFARLLGSDKARGARLWTGSLIALAGVVVIVTQTSGQLSFHLLGDFLALSAAALWAVYQLLTQPMMAKYGLFMVTRKVFGYGILTVLIYMCCRSGEFPRLSLLHLPMVWLNLLFLGLIASLACFLTWNKVIEKLGSIASSNYIYLNPVVTLVLSYLVLGEQITTVAMLGAAGVICGVYVAMTGGKKLQ